MGAERFGGKEEEGPDQGVHDPVCDQRWTVKAIGKDDRAGPTGQGAAHPAMESALRQPDPSLIKLPVTALDDVTVDHLKAKKTQQGPACHFD